MNVLAFAALASLVTASMTVVDFAHARYQRSLDEAWRGKVGARHATSRWSVAWWAAATIAFYCTIRYSMGLLVFEGLGLYIGTWLGAGQRTHVGER